MYRNRRARIIRELGACPGLRDRARRAPVDVEPEPKKRRTRRGTSSPRRRRDSRLARRVQRSRGRPRHRPDVGGRRWPHGEPEEAAAPSRRLGRSARPRRPRRPRRPHRAPRPRSTPPDTEADTDAPELDPAADALPEDVVDARAGARPQQPGQARGATAGTGGADGPARLGAHGAGHLALHDLAAGPLLGGHRRRVRRRAHRRRSTSGFFIYGIKVGASPSPAGTPRTSAAVCYAIPGAHHRHRARVRARDAPRAGYRRRRSLQAGAGPVCA